MLNRKTIPIALLLLVLPASVYALSPAFDSSRQGTPGPSSNAGTAMTQQMTPKLPMNLTDGQWATLNGGGIVKWLEDVKGTAVKKGVAIGIVDALPQDVWAVIHENNDFVHFMPRLLSSILVDPAFVDEAKTMKFDHSTGDPRELIRFLKEHRAEKMTGTTGYFFSLLDVPWPATNRWYIIKLEDHVTKDDWLQKWSLVMGNLKTNDGSWELVPLKGNKTLTVYTVFSDPGGAIPDWIINLGTKQTLPDVIESVRKRVRQESEKKN